MAGQHLTDDPQNRKVHFGFRDSVSRPVVACSLLKDGKPVLVISSEKGLEAFRVSE